MSRRPFLEDLWNSGLPSGRTFDAGILTGLHPTAGRYLKHAIAVGTPLATAVRLQMRGEIKLRRWYPFLADRVGHNPRAKYDIK